MPQVRILSLGPNKHYNFDTIGIETVVLILLPKILVAQGFSAFLFLGKFHCACSHTVYRGIYVQF